MNIDDRPTTDRPQGQFTHFGKISNGHNSATRHPIAVVFGSKVHGVFGDGGSNGAISGWIKSKMASGGHLEKLQMAKSLKRIIRFTLCMYTDHTLPSDSNLYMRETRNLFHKAGSLADLRYKEKE